MPDKTLRNRSKNIGTDLEASMMDAEISNPLRMNDSEGLRDLDLEHFGLESTTV